MPACLAALGFTFTCPVNAATFNVPVAARVVSFQKPPPAKAIVAAIVFDPADPESAAEAVAIERQVGAGLTAGKAQVRVKRVPVNQLSGLAGAEVAFVTSGIRDKHGDIATAAERGGILTISSDLGCVTTGRCVVAVSSEAKVQITVSRAAAKAAKVQFNSAFLMLVKEL
jgi:hypothetical protein